MNVGARQTPELVRSYRDYHEIPYPILFDTDMEVTRAYSIKGIPTFIVVDAKGIIQYRNYVMPPEYLKLIE